MRRRFLTVMLSACVLVLSAAAPFGVSAQSKITEEEAHAIGVDAYLYFYPLVTMDITRKQLTNQEPGPGGIGGPMNMLRQCRRRFRPPT